MYRQLRGGARFGAVTVMLAAFLLLMSTSGWTGESSGSSGAQTMISEAGAYQAFQVLFDELRFSRRVLLPAAGTGADFILMENVSGELVGYVKAGGELYERIIISHQGTVLSRKPWITGVKSARFSALDELWSGRGAELVDLVIRVDCAGSVPVDLQTTVRVGNVSEEWMF